jgi:DNA topoisomerase III
VFDNKKVSDHFAIIPTLQAPSGLSEAEQKLYDLVVRRFMAVFFPSAEYQVTTRISVAAGHSFKTVGKVLVKPGWLAIYGKEAADEVEDAKDGDKGQNLVPVQPGEPVGVESVEAKGLKTRPQHAIQKPRCWAPWKVRARWSMTTSCAKPCKKKAWAHRPPAPPRLKA